MAKKRSQHQAKPASLNSSELVKRRTSTKTKSGTSKTQGDFESLVVSIVQIHQQTQDFAARAVNLGLTLRNWLIGYRIVEFEQQGRDRAAYGERLLPVLAERLAAAGLKRVDTRELRRFRLFYTVYPRIRETVTPELLARSGASALQPLLNFAPLEKRETLSPESPLGQSDLFQRLSFSHLAELCELPDETQRRFYEIECIRGNWSVRELRRQIASLYYERSGLSKDKAKLSLWKCQRSRRWNDSFRRLGRRLAMCSSRENMQHLVAEFNSRFAESAKLEQATKANLKGLGYGG